METSPLGLVISTISVTKFARINKLQMCSFRITYIRLLTKHSACWAFSVGGWMNNWMVHLKKKEMPTSTYTFTMLLSNRSFHLKFAEKRDAVVRTQRGEISTPLKAGFRGSR